MDKDSKVEKVNDVKTDLAEQLLSVFQTLPSPVLLEMKTFYKDKDCKS